MLLHEKEDGSYILLGEARWFSSQKAWYCKVVGSSEWERFDPSVTQMDFKAPLPY